MLPLPRPALLGLALAAGCFSPTGAMTTANSTSTGPTTTSSASAGASASDSTTTTTEAHTTSSPTTTTTTTTGTTTTAAQSSGPEGCGDGDPALEEECDDGNQRDGDGCAADCTKEFRRVFVTSSLFTGDLGGVAGADARCQAAADEAKLPGTYRAWLSTDSYSPAATFFQSPVPYVLVNGTPVADDWNDLVDESLITGIFMTEWGEEPQQNPMPCGDILIPVWTNTSPEGVLLLTGFDCSSWTSTTGLGRTGRAGSSDFQWTQSCEVSCAFPIALYCFEQ